MKESSLTTVSVMKKKIKLQRYKVLNFECV
jgi:hypothetical protein